MGAKNKKKRKLTRHKRKSDKEPNHDKAVEGTEDILNEQQSEELNRKRQHNEDESDKEDKPRKKKKKKQPASGESTDGKKGKKSIRQMKREKFAQRQAEAETSAKDQLKSQCLSYISQWKHDKGNWKFMKAKQVWLNKNKFSPNLVPEASWPLLLEYFVSAKGNIHTTLLEDANKIIKQMDVWIEKNDTTTQNEINEETEICKPDETAYKRARDLLQCLQE